jgi:hypothetical protein
MRIKEDRERNIRIQEEREHARRFAAALSKVFFPMTLENGAGYAEYLGTPAVTQELLEMIARPRSEPKSNWASHRGKRDR